MRFLLWTFVLTFVEISTGIAQRPFSIDQVLSAPFPSHLTSHPATQQVAWVFNEKGVRNIWLAKGPELAGRKMSNFMEDDGQELGNLQFTSDGKHLLFIRGGSKNRNGEVPNPRSSAEPAQQGIWSLNVENGQVEKLVQASNYTLHPNLNMLAFSSGKSVFLKRMGDSTKQQKLFTIRGNPGSLSWSPDGGKPKLAFVSSRGDHSFIGIFDVSTQQLTYLSPTVDHDRYPVWSPSGDRIAFMRFPHEKPQIFVPRREAHPWSICVAEVSTGKVRTIWTAEQGMGSAFRNISASNQLLWGKGDFLVFPWEKSGWTQLYSIPASGGKTQYLTPGEFEVQYVSLSADGTHILYSSNQEDIDKQHIWRVPVEGGKPSQLSSGKSIEWAPSSLDNKQTVVFLRSGPTTPAYPAYLKKGGQPQSLAQNSIPANFPSEQLVEPKQVIFSASDGMDIHGQLFLPSSSQPNEKHPAVLFFHGGSRRQMLLGFHHRGYYHNAYSLNQYLASQGYVVLSVNYRSGIGYGMKFREALNYGAGGASEFRDVLGAGLFLKSHPQVDPEKIGLWGGSYGGYLTALGLAKASELFAAGVDIHGVHDWNPVIQNFIPSYNPLENPEFARLAFESSPLAHMEGWRSPVLLIHGDDDRNVPFSESVDIVHALRNQGVHFEQLVFPDEVHGFLLHRNWLKAYEATADFFDRMLKEKR